MVSPKRVALKTKDSKLWIVTKFRILGSTMMMSAVWQVMPMTTEKWKKSE
jgi:hypothetical protein